MYNKYSVMKYIFLLITLFGVLLVSCNYVEKTPRLFLFENKKYVFSIDSLLKDTLELGEIKSIQTMDNNVKRNKDIIYIYNWKNEENKYNKYNFYFHEPMVFNDQKLGSRINFILFDDSFNEYFFNGIVKTNINISDSLKLDLNKVYVIDNKNPEIKNKINIKSILWSYKDGILGFNLYSDSTFKNVQILSIKKQ